MKEKNWMRTVFMAYGTIDKTLKALDKQVLSDSLSSSSTYGTEETLKLADVVIEKIQRKRKLSALKYLTEECLKNIKEENAKILVLKFIDNFSEAEISEMLKVSVRTLHRKISNGLNECYLFFMKNGCDVNLLEKSFLNEGFIKGIYLKVENLTKGKQKKEQPFCLSSNLDFRNYVVG